MSVSLALLMAVTSALLAVAVCGVLWRKAPVAEAPAPPTEMPDLPSYAPPADSLWTTQLEVGQTFYVQTQSAKYALTLRDPVNGRYDAVRVGPKKSGAVVEERFTMFFSGTFVPYHGFRFREFVPGGNLCYQKIRDGRVLDISPSTPVLRILFSVGGSRRQAS